MYVYHISISLLDGGHISVSILVANQAVAPIHSSANHANHLLWVQILTEQTVQFGGEDANMVIIGAPQAKCPKIARRHS